MLPLGDLNTILSGNSSLTSIFCNLCRKNENKSVRVDEFLGAEDSLKVISDAMVSHNILMKPDSFKSTEYLVSL